MNYDIEIRTLLEDTVLGLIMTYDNADLRGQKLLYYHGIDDPQYFGNIFNQHVFLTMQKCWENELPANLINIINFRPDDYRDSENAFDKKGFDLNLITILQKGSFYNETDFEKKIWVMKQYIIMDYWNEISNNIVFKSWDFRDSLQVSDNILGGYDLLFKKLTKNFVKSESVVEKQKEIFEKKLRGEVITVPSGIAPVDAFTGGWFNGELIITAARPGMGKTTMAIISAIKSAFYHNKKVLFCSLEMPKIQLMNKVAAYQLGLEYHKIKNFEYDKATMNTVFKFYEFLESEQSNLIITDLKEIATISDINNKIKSIKPKLLIVDYLQLVKMEKGIKTKAGNREQEISYISGSLKQIAVVEDIPVIALSQLSRAVEGRSNRRPQLSDLRESGSIEQDADIVIFYYRDAYYKELEGKPFPESERWHLEMKFGKGRDLGTKTLYLDANYITYEVTERTLVPPPII